MLIETFYPENPILKKHIEYYYFLKTDSPDFNTTYYSFPNTLKSLNIHKNAGCEIKPYFTGIFEDPRNKYFTIVQGYRVLPLLVNLRGRLDKVTILFKPLGLNPFIRKSFQEVAGKHSQIFTEWDGSEYTTFLDAFYKTDDNKKECSYLRLFY